MFCPEGQLVSPGTTRKESSEVNSGHAHQMGLPGKDGIGAVGLQSLPPPSKGLSRRTHRPPAARPPISLNSVLCPTFLPQSGASGGHHTQCGRLVLVLRLESQLQMGTEGLGRRKNGEKPSERASRSPKASSHQLLSIQCLPQHPPPQALRRQAVPSRAWGALENHRFHSRGNICMIADPQKSEPTN